MVMLDRYFGSIEKYYVGEVLLLMCLSNSNWLCDTWLQHGMGQRKLRLFILRLGC